MNLLSQFLNPHLNLIQFRHKDQNRNHQGKRPAPGTQEPLHRTLYQKHPLLPHCIQFTSINICKTRRILKRPFQWMHNIKLRKIGSQIQKINNTQNHPSKLINITSNHRSHFRHGQRSIIPPHNDICTRANQHAKPIPLPELTLSDNRHHGSNLDALRR